MWNLARFFTKNSPFFTWLLLTVASIYLLCQHSPYHRSVWFGSANIVTGAVYETANNVNGYFGLRAINDDLLLRIAHLETENDALKARLNEYLDEEKIAADTVSTYNYLLAHVVSNTINQAANYITLDKGSADGIKQDQGVADQNGVVGIVSKVSTHYSLVISLLNPYFRLPAKIKNSDSFGSLRWDGESYEYALVEDFPRNVLFEKGDTIETTSYSSSFPEGVPVGIVENSFEQSANNNFLTLRVRLFTDFSHINAVHVIANADAEEREGLMSKEGENKKKN